jgi:catechol 2,3-dioxygenase-like lactoylglutathione lyase family enzyme
MARKPPWKNTNPRKKAGKKSRKLSPKKKAAAKRSAKRAGRSRPSLVDTIRAGGKKKKKKKASRKEKSHWGKLMQQQVSVITLGMTDLHRSKKSYVEGFGWKPVFENEEVVFCQMNGLMLGTWLLQKLEEDSSRSPLHRSGAFALAHNVGLPAEVDALIATLAQAGRRVLRKADAPLHGGYRGYIADPDDHAWEIAFNPAWKIDAEGRVTFGF